MDYLKEHRTGLIGTLITHAVVLALLLFFGFFTPLPLPGEEGILVNFGDSETGFGAEEPAPSETAPVKDQEEKQAETKTPPPPPVKKVETPVEKKTLMTQDMEKTVALQKKEEEQKIALAAAEKRKAGEINNRAKNAFGGPGQGTADSKSTGQGVTYGPVNQGSPQGTANADKYGPGGGIGAGISASLDGRIGLSFPPPDYPGNDDGIVVVEVTVNKAGQVTKAEAGVKGSNTADPDMIAAARKAALQARFNADENAPAFQVGTITYRFVLVD